MSPTTISQATDLAKRHLQAGRVADAELLSRQVLQQEPQNANALHLLGMVAFQAGHHNDAMQLIQAAINQNPNSADFRIDLGAVLMGLNRHDEVIECCQTALSIDPASTNALYLLGNALLMTGRPEQAIDIYRQALRLTPNLFGILVNMGCALKDLDRLEEAAVSFQSVLSFAPECAAACNNLGATLSLSGQIDQSVALHRKALSMEPDNGEFHWNYALALLSNGHFREGWEEFEWRLRSPARKLNRGFPQPQWDGSDLAGKTILLHAEGGFGDGIQFVRYLPMVAQRGGRILLECQPELVRLLAQVPGFESIIARGDPLPEFDVHIPLPSLPRIFQTTLEKIPGSVPYLAAGPKETEYWKQRLSQNPGPKVGLVWAGSSNNARWRSGTHGIFSPLADIPGIQFYSLQKSSQASGLAPPGLSLIDYTDELRDFADTAGLVANLDLVISVDTSVAHLAGAMAKPIWTLIPYASDFRWLRNREDSPWYPTMKLFRQGKDRDWNRVTEKIAAELRSRFG